MARPTAELQPRSEVAPVHMRCCPGCGVDCQPDVPVCPVCRSSRPPTGWTRVMVRGVTPLLDGSGWGIEATLRPNGPLLRYRVRRALPGVETELGIMIQVSETALFPVFDQRCRLLLERAPPGVCAPLATGQYRGRPYRIDPLTPAPRLIAARAQPQTRTAPDCIRLVGELAETVQDLHRQGFIHGHVHPSAIVQMHAGDRSRLLLLEPPAIPVGPWLRDAAPEVLRGSPPDPRSDVFGLGVVLWSLLTGNDPRAHFLDGRDPQQGTTALPVADTSGLSPAQIRLLARMLDRSPARRPERVSQVLAELQGLPAPSPAPQSAPSPPPSSEAVPARPAPTVMASAGPSRSRLLPVFIGGALAAAAALSIFSPEGPPADPAVETHQQAIRTSRPAPDSSAVAATPNPEPTSVPSEPLALPTDTAPTAPPEPVHPALAMPAASPAPKAAAEPPPSRPASEVPAADGASAPPAPTDPDEPADQLETPSAPPPTLESTAERSAPEAHPAPPPVPPPSAETLLNGRWQGNIDGQPATLELVVEANGSITGTASIHQGLRTTRHKVQGLVRIHPDQSATLSLGLRGTRMAWSGRIAHNQFSGFVTVGGKARGAFTLAR